MNASQPNPDLQHLTRVVKVDVSQIGHFVFKDSKRNFLDEWELQSSKDSADIIKVKEAASLIRHTNTPVAFPTETVYGLGADATRSSAVQGIYKAKQRPSDNPLIVHISSLSQLRKLLSPEYNTGSSSDPIPPIYHPLIERFWPGPLTIILSLPKPSPFASEVTTSLSTVGVRMPRSRLALALIHEAGVPLAAPSANASTKPSPTTAEHVLHDLNGRIELIIDGGPCQVGVESTVVDGLSRLPSILRPGGVSIESLRMCPGWDDVQIGYKDKPQTGDVPRAPGMKYKHYSPKARVVLFKGAVDSATLRRFGGEEGAVGILMTSGDRGPDLLTPSKERPAYSHLSNSTGDQETSTPVAEIYSVHLNGKSEESTLVWCIRLGHTIHDVARGLFSALRELDSKGVRTILVETVDESEGDTAAAVMNRLRKAAESEIVI